MTKVKFCLLNDARAPTKAHETDACWDIFSNKEIVIQGHETIVVPTGLKVEIPPGWELQVRPRSGLAAKFGLTILNSPGTIDAGYRGEIKVDRGRLIINRPYSIEIIEGTTHEAWNRDKALVAVRTATKFKKQVDKCLECPWGCLVDVRDNRVKKKNFYRNMFCLKAMPDWHDCYVKSLESLKR